MFVHDTIGDFITVIGILVDRQAHCSYPHSNLRAGLAHLKGWLVSIVRETKSEEGRKRLEIRNMNGESAIGNFPSRQPRS